MRRRPSGTPIEDDDSDPNTNVNFNSASEPTIQQLQAQQLQPCGRAGDAHIYGPFDASRSSISLSAREEGISRREGGTPRSSLSNNHWRSASNLAAGEREKQQHSEHSKHNGGFASRASSVESVSDSSSTSAAAMEPRYPRRSRFRSPWSCSWLILTTTVAAFLVMAAIMHSAATRQIDPEGCNMSYTISTYIRLNGFDTEHTRFATKYALHLYKEETVDEYSEQNIGLKGAPVFFIPGNAGSYKQARSLASEASRHFYDVVRHDQESLRTGTRALDFFTVDFNEDLAAFHGQTLMDQAEYINEAVAYILSLYHDPHRSRRDPSLPDPSSVILVGHSMGGIVARMALTMPNYQSNSINTIMTMSAPHARPPISFDADIVAAYKQMNDYWRHAYAQKWANNNPLWHVTLISIAGGGLDTIVPSDYASLSSLVPDTHGFTVFTSTIANVWTGMDHLAITWCDQFRKVLIGSLFDIVDVRRSAQTRPRAERMRIFKKWFLTGMEDFAERTLPESEPTTLLTLGDDSNSILSQGKRLVLRGLGAQRHPQATLLPLPPQGVSGKKFTLLTDQILDESGGSGMLEVLFCSVFPLQSGQSSSVFSMNMDLSGDSTGSTRLACKNAQPDVIRLPASTRSSKQVWNMVSSQPVKEFQAQMPFSYLQYTLEELSEHQFVAVVDKASSPIGGWVVAEFSDSSDAEIRTKFGLGRLLAGLNIRLPAARPLVTEVQIPAMHSSLLSYKLRLGTLACADEAELFTPMIRQHVDGPYESKYFVNVKEANINLHGIAPFMPPPLRGQSANKGLALQLWSDPTCDASLDLSIEVDIPGSIGKLVIRYRTVMAAFPLFVVALVLRKQFKTFDETGVFIPFTESLHLCLRSSLPLLLVVLSILATSLSTSSSSTHQKQSENGLFGWRTNATETPIDFTKNDLLLGSSDAFFWFLVPLFGLISIGVCVAVNYIALLVVHIFSSIFGLSSAFARSGYIRHDERRTLSSLTQSASLRRILNICILILLVTTIVPYQFAYLVACLVQLITCTRALRQAREMRSPSNTNFSNYCHSILILMLWILPINLPVLVVWAKNLQVHWLTPFSSHHNVFSVMPFIILVETLCCSRMIPRITTHFRHLTSFLFIALALYAALYGVTYAYLLHHFVNFVVAWLVGLHYSGTSSGELRQIGRFLDGEEGSGSGSGDDSDGRTKKIP